MEERRKNIFYPSARRNSPRKLHQSWDAPPKSRYSHYRQMKPVHNSDGRSCNLLRATPRIMLADTCRRAGPATMPWPGSYPLIRLNQNMKACTLAEMKMEPSLRMAPFHQSSCRAFMGLQDERYSCRLRHRRLHRWREERRPARSCQCRRCHRRHQRRRCRHPVRTTWEPMCRSKP